VATRTPRKTIVVYCEGSRTEPDYLAALKRLPAVRDVAAVDIRVQPGRGRTNPRQLVSRAVAAKLRATAEGDEVDEFWCIFDVEWPINHPGLTEAVDEARQHRVDVAISNPCFELWLILHLHPQSAWLTTEQACKLRGTLDESHGKEINATTYMPHTAVAARRAAALDDLHKHNETSFPRNNPSSGMHRLLATLQPTTAVGP
jgi:hypothetical protein